MTAENHSLIEARGLKKYFKVSKGNLHAVDNVNFEIKQGTTLGVVGESGCGKSTLGRTILRLIEPTAGEIFYNGENIVGFSPKKMREMRKNMQIIFQDPYSSINPRMSVSEIVAEFMVVNKTCSSKRELRERTSELMEIVGLAERLADAYPHELDGGRRQRIGIARALSLNPKFIVCDEPVSALDVSIQAQILNLLMDLQDEYALTYMFITHNLSVVKHISDEIMVMYLGHCVEKAPSKELFKNPLHPYTKALLSAIPIPDIDRRKKEIHPIKGEVTSPINPKPGCRFAPRCPLVSSECTGKDIELRDFGNSHLCACVMI
ncbi:MAG: ATP-binding cassette domain-containing protein [Synergistaceae bacterium]|nr:ATP-binding cassette domain-containing protein [Synergistota bacterium]NLM72146.1 ATP-binding cassette domain-containing protein [Synergistaceae bacterium]